MENIQKLPALKDIRQFASAIEPFPTTGLGIARLARRKGYGATMISFLELFSGEAIFYSRQQFLQTCRLLKRLIKEEMAQPKESVSTSED